MRTKLIVGSLANVIIFGAADAITGRFDRGLKKFALLILIAVVATLLEETIGGAYPSLDGWIFWIVARVYVFVALFDGVFTILRAQNVVL